MGVDYNGNYGVGYQVVAGDNIAQDEIEDGIVEYLYSKVEGDFDHFQVGAGSYSGEEDECFIVIKDAFSDGLDLTKKKEALDEELKRLKLKPVGEFGDVGGLYVW